MDARTIGCRPRHLILAILATMTTFHARADAISGITAVPGGFRLGQCRPGPHAGPRRPDPLPGGDDDPVLDPRTGDQIQSYIGYSAISPGGTIAYTQGSYGYGATARAYVLKDGQTFNAGTASDGSLAGGDPYSIAHAVNDAGAVAGESHAYGRWNRAFSSTPGPNGTYQPVAMGAMAVP